MIPQQDLPLFQRALAALPLGGALAARRAARGRAAIDQCPRVAGVAQNLVHPTLAWQPPDDLRSPRAADHLGEQELLVAQVQHGLPRAAERGELREHHRDGVLDLTVRYLLDAVVLGAYESHRQLPQRTAALDLLLEGRAGTLPKEAQLELAHRSLEAQQSPIIDETRVVDAVVVHQHRLVQGAQIDQVVPVTVVARQA